MADSKAGMGNIQGNLEHLIILGRKEVFQTYTHYDGSLAKGYKSQLKELPMEKLE